MCGCIVRDYAYICGCVVHVGVLWVIVRIYICVGVLCVIMCICICLGVLCVIMSVYICVGVLVRVCIYIRVSIYICICTHAFPEPLRMHMQYIKYDGKRGVIIYAYVFVCVCV